ncbi:MAG TPA: response regulator [Methylomirabilota bacterium]|nr:response regulator [Methylomirabilota bacterium]
MKKILIIEDDPVVGLVYQRFLEKQGFATELAADGVKGLERVTAFQPDAVLVDMMMPRVGGIAVIQSLRADKAFRDLPMVVMSNACVPTLVEQAIKAGANHVIDKSTASPLAISELFYSLLKIGAENGAAAKGTVQCIRL